MSNFKDHFSNHAACYAEGRPTYPRELFEFLAGLVSARDLAWDVGAGNGQASVGLAEFFGRVIATDASADQIAHAAPHPRVEYRVALAHDTDLAPDSIDLVTIAQAIHWFPLDAFYAHARMVTKPEGLIAAWCYTLPRVNADIDAVCDWFYRDVTGPYWPADRKHIEAEYKTLPFPFERIGADTAGRFACKSEWAMGRYLAYIASWSAVQGYRKHVGSDPMPLMAERLAPAWRDPQCMRQVRFPIHLLVGRARS